MIIYILVFICRKIKKEIKVLEDEIPRAQVLVFPMTGINPVEFEPQTLAVLRGRLVRYLMRSREVNICSCLLRK
jgi:microspherule protein 1